jgi:hypothetical protein
MPLRTSLVTFIFVLLSTQLFAQDNDLYSIQTVDVGLDVTRPIEVIDLYKNKGKELLVFGADEERKIWMVVLGPDQNNKYSVLSRTQLPDNIIAYDIGVEQSNGLRDLYFLTKSHIKKYIKSDNPEQYPFFDEQAVSSIYITDKSTFFRKKSFVRDLNGDQVDDFILPHFERTNLWLSCACETRHPQSISSAGQMDVFRESIEFTPPRLKFFDMNKDDRMDIVTPHLGALHVYLQQADGLFKDEPQVVNINADINPNYWWELREADGSQKDQSNIVHKVLEKIDDINGDGIADLLVQHSKGSGVLKQVNDFEFYFGQLLNGTLAFSDTPNTRIAIDERLLDPTLVDLNGDKKKEVLLSSFDISISDIVSALFSRKVKQDILVFGMDDQDKFNEDPLVRDDVEIRFSLSSGQTGNPMFTLKDIDGDNAKDLLLSDGEDKIKVRLADQGKQKSFARRAKSYNLNLPRNAATVTNKDINADQKSDLVMYYGRLDDESFKNKIVIATAK